MTREEQQRPRKRRAAFELIRLAAEVFVLFLIFSTLIGRFEIHQVSMEPNFHEGQRVIVSKLSSVSAWVVRTAHAAERDTPQPFAPKHGQVVVFFDPQRRTADALIKRVIAIPNDTIELRDGAVFVNGAKIDEPYAYEVTDCQAICGPLTLKPGDYFLLGDNRPNSLDSRTFGPVSVDQIVGRVVLRYWPFDQVTFYP